MKIQYRTQSWWLPLIALGAGCSAEQAGSVAPSSPIAAAGSVAVAQPKIPSAPSANSAGASVMASVTPVAAPAVQTPAAPDSAPAAVSSSPSGSLSPISADCQGFKLEGLLYSPGGTVLPNKCAPYHPTTNNPYAVRCVDAWSWYKTQFPGDAYCILPPPADKGVQYGVHPQGAKWFEQVSKGDLSGYENISDEWTLKVGEEETANYETAASNPAEAKYYRSYARMRPGSHHMIVTSDPSRPGDEKWIPASPGGLIEGAAGLLGGARQLPGAQRPDENRPQPFDKPQEDAGLYAILPAKAKVTFNMHHFNATSSTILKEVWTNVWWEEDARTPMQPMKGLDVAQVITMNIPAGDTQDLHYSWTIAQPIRVMEAFGHRHAWTSNFSAWVEDAQGETDILYQSFGWQDEPTYRYDSITKNPNPAAEKRSDGGSSGIRMLMPGQKLHFNCHIEFTEERAAAEKAPSPSKIGALRFANEAFTGEMCILFGATAAVEMGAPVVDNTPLPDFATLD